MQWNKGEVGERKVEKEGRKGRKNEEKTEALGSHDTNAQAFSTKLQSLKNTEKKSTTVADNYY